MHALLAVGKGRAIDQGPLSVTRNLRVRPACRLQRATVINNNACLSVKRLCYKTHETISKIAIKEEIAKSSLERRWILLISKIGELDRAG